MKKKVLFVATYGGNSGASHSINKLSYDLKNQYGYEVLVIVPNKGFLTDKLERDKIDYRVIKFYPWVIDNKKIMQSSEKIKWFIKRIINDYNEKKLKKINMNYKPDIIHINAITANFGAKTALKMNIPLVWHIREFLEEDLNKQFWDKDKSLNQVSLATYQVPVSKSVGDKYQELLPHHHINVVYNGIDDALYDNSVNKIFNDTVTKILILGRIVPEKGQLEAIRAIGILVNMYKRTDILLEIVGPNSNESYYEELKKEILNLKIEKYCHFISETDKPYDYMKNADISLICSKAEAFGRVTVESIFCGSYVIGKNTAGTSEILQDTWMLYDDDLPEKIIKVLDNKEEAKNRLLNVRKEVYEKFRASNNSKNMVSMYDSLMKG